MARVWKTKQGSHEFFSGTTKLGESTSAGAWTFNHNDAGTGDLDHLQLQKQGITRLQIGSNQAVGLCYLETQTGYGFNFNSVSASGTVGSFSALGAWSFGASSGLTASHTIQSGSTSGVVAFKNTANDGAAYVGFKTSSDTMRGQIGASSANLVEFYNGAGTFLGGSCSNTGNWQFTATSGATIISNGSNNNNLVSNQIWRNSDANVLGFVDNAGNWTLSTISGAGFHTFDGLYNSSGTPIVKVVKQNVAINTSGNSYVEFYGSSGGFDGYIGISGTTLSIIDSSDSRKKENIREANFGIEELKKLRPVIFDWKEEFGGGKNVKGFIAQEVEHVLPECVTTKKDGEFDDSKFLSVTNMIPVMVKAIQELNAKIELLEGKLN
jgi:hypothetical protein